MVLFGHRSYTIVTGSFLILQLVGISQRSTIRGETNFTFTYGLLSSFSHYYLRFYAELEEVFSVVCNSNLTHL